MIPRRRSLPIGIAVGSCGILGLLTGLNRPTIAAMRAVDVVHLLGSGACLGVMIAMIVLFLVDSRPRTSDPTSHERD